MKKLLSLGILCASVIAAPLAAHATQIVGSDSINLTFPSTGATTLAGATSFSWTGGSTGAGAGNFTGVPSGSVIGGDTTINLLPGTDGGSLANPFTFTIANFGTFIATTDVTVFFLGATGPASSSGTFVISGFFFPAGALASAGYTQTSADITFAVTQSGGTYGGGFTLVTPSNFDPPPPVNPVPEPSSLALLGTGIMTGVGFLRRRNS